MKRREFCKRAGVVSAAQLSNIRAGQTVEITSGTAGGHSHLFTFLKLG